MNDLYFLLSQLSHVCQKRKAKWFLFVVALVTYKLFHLAKRLKVTYFNIGWGQENFPELPAPEPKSKRVSLYKHATFNWLNSKQKCFASLNSVDTFSVLVGCGGLKNGIYSSISATWCTLSVKWEYS